MVQVRQYADPLFAIRKQIENKEYDLDEIMYQRMKKYIKQLPFFTIYYVLSDNNKKIINLNVSNIDDRTYKDAFLNFNYGYKNIFLRNNLRKINEDMICGLNPFQKWLDFQASINYVDKNICQNIIYSFEQEKHGVCCYTYAIKEFYKIWVKL
jgi:hypothetical protein